MTNNIIDLSEIAQEGIKNTSIELVRLNEDETPIVLFTVTAVITELHWCGESEIYSYVQCNGEDCVLCQIGRKKDTRYLIPVYLPVEKSIGILPVSPSMRPYALLPQLTNIFNNEEPKLVFIKKSGAAKFNVSSVPIPDNYDVGDEQILKFYEENKDGLSNLESVYQKIDNQVLKMVPEIGSRLELKGLVY